MLKAMGSIIMAVAVLETHRLMKAVMAMNPPTMAAGAVPTHCKALRAMRRCRFHRSSA